MKLTEAILEPFEQSHFSCTHQTSTEPRAFLQEVAQALDFDPQSMQSMFRASGIS